jgi:ATP-dependent Clp protease ATP-binding subunit ClpC
MKREGLGFQSSKDEMVSEKVEDLVRSEVKRTFNPEFLNRVDEIILFMALSEADLIQILELMVSQLNQNLAQRSITVTVADEAKKWILNQTLTDRSYGARPLRRALQKYIEDPLSEALIQGTITTRPAFIEVFLESNKLYYRPVDCRENRRRAAVRELESAVSHQPSVKTGGFCFCTWRGGVSPA